VPQPGGGGFVPGAYEGANTPMFFPAKSGRRRKATGGGREAVIATIFWLKTRAGWREANVYEIGV
jgi:hypothetical protein